MKNALFAVDDEYTDMDKEVVRANKNLNEQMLGKHNFKKHTYIMHVGMQSAVVEANAGRLMRMEMSEWVTL